jgi:DNA-binding LacI/PurR family transcriptional regulator
MADVARQAGVSHQTVSRVLNGHPNVSPATRASVLAAIRELGYRPNAAARTLVTGRTNVLGVISLDTTLYGPASMLYGIERAAHPGYSVAIASLASFDRRSLPEAVEWFLGQSVDGIIVIAPETAAVDALTELAAGIPLVAVGCGTRAPLPSVAIDNLSGAAQATRHLLDLGHETVHHIGGPESWLDAQERAEGWRQALRSAGADGLRDRPPAGRHARGDRGAVRQRPDGARPAPRPGRAGPPRARGRQRGGIRRRARGRVLPAAADDGAPGFR